MTRSQSEDPAGDERSGAPAAGGPSGPGRLSELDREIRHHILERADALVRNGWERKEALCEAERRFGDIERIRAEMISARWKKGGRMKVFGMLRSVGADLRHALRGIRSAPGFTAGERGGPPLPDGRGGRLDAGGGRGPRATAHGA